MKQLKKMLQITLIIALITPLFVNRSLTVHAEVDEMWGVPFLAFGGSLNPAQKQEILELFDLDDLEEGVDFNSVAVTGHDMVYFLGQGNPQASMLSSVLITNRPAGTGIVVEIITPELITRVTETQYMTAMITAGVTDALVQIAAPIAVTGEAALTGIYKAYAEVGVELDAKRMEVAQEQLQMLTSIASELNHVNDFDSEVLDLAIIDVQQRLADFYDTHGSLASSEDIVNIIETVLNNHQLSDILNADQIGRIRGFASNFQLTDAIRSPQFREQLSQVENRIGNLIGNLDLNIDRGMISSWWHNLVEWFRNLFN